MGHVPSLSVLCSPCYSRGRVNLMCVIVPCCWLSCFCGFYYHPILFIPVIFVFCLSLVVFCESVYLAAWLLRNSKRPVTQYPIPAITVPGRMRYSRHKRSGISYSCHNKSPLTTFSCHKLFCFAISYPLSRIYCRGRVGDLEMIGVSADDCSLQPPPNGSSMAMQINARTHSEPFMATKSFHTPLPRPSTLMQSFHIPWTFYGNEVMYTLKLYWHCFAIQIIMQSIIIIHYPLYDTAMICKGRSKNGQGGPLYDTAVIICKGMWKNNRRSGECVCVVGVGGSRDVEIFHCHRRSRGYVERFHEKVWEGGDVERLCCHKWFRVCTSINLHCHRWSIGRW